MSTITELDIPSAKERFMGNESLYKMFLGKFLNDTAMANLEKHLSENNLEEAFKDAHTLKGLVGNLSLNNLMKNAITVTEQLRGGSVPAEADMDALRESYRAAVADVKKVQEENLPLF